MEEFAPYFAEVPDPRASNARHDFLEVMFIALAAVLCGAEDCTDMALFARTKLGLLQQVMKLKHGAPSHDTFSRVFRPDLAGAVRGRPSADSPPPSRRPAEGQRWRSTARRRCAEPKRLLRGWRSWAGRDLHQQRKLYGDDLELRRDRRQQYPDQVLVLPPAQRGCPGRLVRRGVPESSANFNGNVSGSLLTVVFLRSSGTSRHRPDLSGHRHPGWNDDLKLPSTRPEHMEPQRPTCPYAHHGKHSRGGSGRSRRHRRHPGRD